MNNLFKSIFGLNLLFVLLGIGLTGCSSSSKKYCSFVKDDPKIEDTQEGVPTDEEGSESSKGKKTKQLK